MHINSHIVRMVPRWNMNTCWWIWKINFILHFHEIYVVLCKNSSKKKNNIKFLRIFGKNLIGISFKRTAPVIYPHCLEQTREIPIAYNLYFIEFRDFRILKHIVKHRTQRVPGSTPCYSDVSFVPKPSSFLACGNFALGENTGEKKNGMIIKMVQKCVRLVRAYKQTDTRNGTEGFEMIDTASSCPVPKGLIKQKKKKMKNENEGRCGIWASIFSMCIFDFFRKLN